MFGSNAVLAGTALLGVGMPIQATQPGLRQLMMGNRTDKAPTSDSDSARRLRAQYAWRGEGFKRRIGGKHLEFEAIEGCGPDDSGQTIGTPSTADGFRPPEGSIPMPTSPPPATIG